MIWKRAAISNSELLLWAWALSSVLSLDSLGCTKECDTTFGNLSWLKALLLFFIICKMNLEQPNATVKSKVKNSTNGPFPFIIISRVVRRSEILVWQAIVHLSNESKILVWQALVNRSNIGVEATIPATLVPRALALGWTASWTMSSAWCMVKCEERNELSFELNSEPSNLNWVLSWVISWAIICT